ncbi:MAG: adenosylmethionine--8-amino-7-oxononanoate transaminase [Proteobacteria bacterium]|nr:adenosylmethionine--8-amino-7-oxononanoate transaminase [Pseudomonadota bacterium]
MNKKISNDWVKRSRKAVWHPYTQMKHHENFPMIALEKAKGCWLYDYDGHRYFDAISSWWVNLFGHSNTKINAALTKQLNTLEHAMLAGFTHRPVVELSERLARLTQNNLGHVFYGSDGASAVEIALKMSFHFWVNSGQKKKNEFVCLRNSYHGETLGALSVSDISLYKDVYGNLLNQVNVVDGPDSRHKNVEEKTVDYCLEKLEQILQLKNDRLAAVILEPLVQGAAGMVMYDAAYVNGARRLCDKYGVHLIADEIAVGFGRTGTMFACEQANVWPDFLVLSKGISGGYLPLSLVMTTEDIYQAFYSNDIAKGFLHSHTYTANPLACTAALTVLDIFESERILSANRILSLKIKKELQWVASDCRFADFRNLGMMFAFEVQGGNLGIHFPRKVFREAAKHELLLRPIGQTIYVVPPYTTSDEEIVHLSESLKKTLNKVLGSK